MGKREGYPPTGGGLRLEIPTDWIDGSIGAGRKPQDIAERQVAGVVLE